MTIAFVAALPAPSVALAVQLGVDIVNDFGVASDVGPYRATVFVKQGQSGMYGGRFDCTPGTARIEGASITVEVQVLGGEPGVVCQSYASAAVGPLAPGEYTVVAHATLPDGSLQTLTTTLAVAPRGALCNVDPYNNRLWFQPRRDYTQFCRALATDAGYRAALGDVVCAGTDNLRVYLAFPVLADPVRTMDAVLKSGDVSTVGRDGSTFCFDPPPASVMGTAVEYYNTPLDHYFFTADEGEQAAIDAGAVGPGWRRTGQAFTVEVRPGCPAAIEGGHHPIYRFAGIPGKGPSSHFFTATQAECAVVRDRVDWGWGFEGAPFWATEPVNGQCSDGQPLYRAYNAGKGGAPNHRYSTNRAVIATMVAQGWIDEGLAMCVAR